MDDTRLANICDQLLSGFGYKPVMAAELECYVPGLDNADDWWRTLHDEWLADKLPLLRIEKERGAGQYELVLGLNSPQGLLQNLARLKTDVLEHAERTNMQVSFSAKPFEGQPASGLHLHLHLENADQANVFSKSDEGASVPLSRALAGLISLMPVAYDFYCPHESDKLRFSDADHVPRANCWGANNRYCAVRIPSTIDIYDKWLELRVASSDAKFSDAIGAMLASVHMGLAEQMVPPPQEYGKPHHRFLEDLQNAVLDDALLSGFLGLMQSNALLAVDGGA